MFITDLLLQEVAAVTLPIKEDANMKEYLLDSQMRGCLIEKSHGKLQTVNGIKDLGSLVANR